MSQEQTSEEGRAGGLASLGAGWAVSGSPAQRPEPCTTRHRLPQPQSRLTEDTHGVAGANPLPSPRAHTETELRRGQRRTLLKIRGIT